MKPETLAEVTVKVVASQLASAGLGTFIPIRPLLEFFASPALVAAVTKALREEIRSIDGLDAKVVE